MEFIVFLLGGVIVMIIIGLVKMSNSKKKLEEINRKKEHLKEANNDRLRIVSKYGIEYQNILNDEPKEKYIKVDGITVKNQSWLIWSRKKEDFEFLNITDEKKEAIEKVSKGENFIIKNNLKNDRFSENKSTKWTPVHSKSQTSFIPLSIKKDKTLESVRGINLISFRDYDVLVSTINSVDVLRRKFSFQLKKEHSFEEILSLMMVLKILRSIEENYHFNKENYHIEYITRTFHNSSTISFDYNRASFTIIINTGLSFENETRVKNKPISFKVLESQFLEIIRFAEKNFPKKRFEELIIELVGIAKMT